MLIGHFGVALGLKRLAPTISLAWLAFAATFIDLLLWVLVLVGIEEVITPPNYGELHYLRFVFPFSHSLIGALVYSGVFGVLAYLFTQRTPHKTAASVMSLAVFSHWFLDFLVHPKQLPAVGETSVKLGLGLWNSLWLALAVETLIFVGGLVIYYQGTRARSGIGKYGPVVLFGVVAVVSLGGQAFGAAPPSGEAVAASTLALLVVAILLSGWVDAQRRAVGR